ncbi:hypothetical protein WJX84_002606 [Apatococcus fuscideae]|uniref:BRCT domain-containing protein n=1 Tax=Apatococcus fuscideae TaxID=2026836 RepID=A0AAW1RUP0_9CHLO
MRISTVPTNEEAPDGVQEDDGERRTTHVQSQWESSESQQPYCTLEGTQAELSWKQDELAQSFMRDGNIEDGLQTLLVETVIEAALPAVDNLALQPQEHGIWWRRLYKAACQADLFPVDNQLPNITSQDMDCAFGQLSAHSLQELLCSQPEVEQRTLCLELHGLWPPRPAPAACTPTGIPAEWGVELATADLYERSPGGPSSISPLAKHPARSPGERVTSPMNSMMISHISASLPVRDTRCTAHAQPVPKNIQKHIGGEAERQQQQDGDQHLRVKTSALKRQPARDRHGQQGRRLRKRNPNPPKEVVTPPTEQRQPNHIRPSPSISPALPKDTPRPSPTSGGHEKSPRNVTHRSLIGRDTWKHARQNQEPVSGKSNMDHHEVAELVNVPVAEPANPYSFEESQGEPELTWAGRRRVRPKLGCRSSPAHPHRRAMHPPQHAPTPEASMPTPTAALQTARKAQHPKTSRSPGGQTRAQHVAPHLGKADSLHAGGSHHHHHRDACDDGAAARARHRRTRQHGIHETGKKPKDMSDASPAMAAQVRHRRTWRASTGDVGMQRGLGKTASTRATHLADSSDEDDHPMAARPPRARKRPVRFCDEDNDHEDAEPQQPEGSARAAAAAEAKPILKRRRLAKVSEAPQAEQEVAGEPTASIVIPPLGCSKCRKAKNGCGRCRSDRADALKAAGRGAEAAEVLALKPGQSKKQRRASAPPSMATAQPEQPFCHQAPPLRAPTHHLSRRQSHPAGRSNPHGQRSPCGANTAHASGPTLSGPARPSGSGHSARAEAERLASCMGATILSLGQVFQGLGSSQLERPIDMLITNGSPRSAKYLAALTMGCPVLDSSWLQASSINLFWASHAAVMPFLAAG